MDLKQREEKIKAKRKQTDFRQYVKEIASWFSLVLYRKDGLVSRYPDTSRVKKIIPFHEFHKREDERVKQGRVYDENISFLEQRAELFQNILHPNVINYYGVENADFANEVLRSKNIYLSHTIIGDCENVCYTANCKENCNNIYNSMMVRNYSENVYFGTGIIKSQNIFYSKYIKNSFNIWFSSNLIGCQNCLFCNNLENQKYCIQNKQYTAEDFIKEKTKILKQKEKFLSRYQSQTDLGKNWGSSNTTGIFVQDSVYVENGYYSYQLKNCRNIMIRGGEGVNEDMCDVLSGGTVGNADFYAVCGAGAGSDNLYCSCHIVSSHIYYSYFTQSCSYCLGCFGLVNRQFCILNKQYTKEERFEKADKIFAQMEKNGTLGNFFPPSMNPYYFNDTLAYIIDDSFTKEEVTTEGYLRRDEKIKVDIPEGADIIQTKDLNQYQGFDENGNWKIDLEILKKVIVDEKGNYYRIVKMEYDFLMKHGLPLPEIHWLERIKLGFKFK